MKKGAFGTQQKFRLFVAGHGLTTTPAMAGSHHWQSWMQGAIDDVDATRQVVVVQDSQSGLAMPFHWNRRTRLWDESTNPKDHGRSVKAEALTAGETVSVLSQRASRGLLAVRIVIRRWPARKTTMLLNRR